MLSKHKKVWDDFRDGDDHALAIIYNEHVQLLFRYGKKLTNNRDLIKDSIQDLFFNLIDSRGRLGQTDNITFYLIKSFRRKLIFNIQKEKKSTQELQFPNPDEEEHTYAEDQINQDQLIKEVLQKLSPKQQEILTYRYILSFSYEEICSLMSIKYDSARKMVYRALISARDKASVNSPLSSQ
jgi:RNA polymerase sigma factor (sigma-70 family)